MLMLFNCCFTHPIHVVGGLPLGSLVSRWNSIMACFAGEFSGRRITCPNHRNLCLAINALQFFCSVFCMNFSFDILFGYRILSSFRNSFRWNASILLIFHFVRVQISLLYMKTLFTQVLNTFSFTATVTVLLSQRYLSFIIAFIASCLRLIMSSSVFNLLPRYFIFFHDSCPFLLMVNCSVLSGLHSSCRSFNSNGIVNLW